MSRAALRERAVRMCRQYAQRDWMQAADRNKLLTRLAEARRRRDYLMIPKLEQALRVGEERFFARYMQFLEDKNQMIRNVEKGLSDKEQADLAFLSLKSVILADHLQSCMLEMYSRTRHLECGPYNPFAPESLRQALDELTIHLGYMYKDQEQKLIDEFIKEADKTDELVGNAVRKLQREMIKKGLNFSGQET